MGGEWYVCDECGECKMNVIYGVSFLRMLCFVSLSVVSSVVVMLSMMNVVLMVVMVMGDMVNLSRIGFMWLGGVGRWICV